MYPKITNFEHLIGAFINSIQVPDGEPLAQSRTDLDEPTKYNQRFLLIKRSNFRDIILRKRIFLRRIQLENVARVLREIIHLTRNCRNRQRYATGAGIDLATPE